MLMVVVLAISGFVVSRLHKIFGSEDLNANAGAGIDIVQFNPKVVIYEISGPPDPPPTSTFGTPTPTHTR
ncbi:conserved membrane family protein [Mycobacterium ulcerans str. Harvey]|uniref:Conserved membrane family protein n=1 Tax=Mycobacterium ulcerans str. Harvey TaxID=1299332 RepID=A0ABN0QS68_MYCUL|nr:conserved membrane family protein [Mycobacterium ulcerans str. Harvey]